MARPVLPRYIEAPQQEQRTLIRNSLVTTVYGIDLGMNIFHVAGTDAAGNVVQRLSFRRDMLLAFFEHAARAIVDIEAYQRRRLADLVAGNACE